MDKKTDDLNKTPFIKYGLLNVITKTSENVIPDYITSKHLTLLTLLWALLMFFLYKKMPYIIPITIMCWMVSDAIDGHMGRVRNEGFIKWGYFADHSFDYIMFVTIIYSIYNLTDNKNKPYILLNGVIALFQMFMSHLSLDDNGLTITTCPTKNFCLSVFEIHTLLSIGLLFMINPKTKTIDINNTFLKYFTYLFVFGTIVRFIQTQHKLSEKDKQNKKKVF